METTRLQEGNVFRVEPEKQNALSMQANFR